MKIGPILQTAQKLKSTIKLKYNMKYKSRSNGRESFEVLSHAQKHTFARFISKQGFLFLIKKCVMFCFFTFFRMKKSKKKKT